MVFFLNYSLNFKLKEKQNGKMLHECFITLWIKVITVETYCVKTDFYTFNDLLLCDSPPQMNIFLYILSSRASCSLRHHSIEKEPRVWVSWHFHWTQYNHRRLILEFFICLSHHIQTSQRPQCHLLPGFRPIILTFMTSKVFFFHV